MSVEKDHDVFSVPLFCVAFQVVMMGGVRMRLNLVFRRCILRCWFW